MKVYWNILKAAGTDFMEDKALRLSAALAYYSVFSIGPILVLVVGIAGLVLGDESVRREVDSQLKSLFGSQSAGLLKSMMAARSQEGSLMATIIGGTALLFGASGVFGQLQEALNTIWEVQTKAGQGVLGFVRQRFLSLTMVLGTGFLLLVSMVLSALVSAFAGYVGNLISTPEWLIRGINLTVSFGLISLLFAAIFKVLPDVKIQWRDVWVGGVVTAALFTTGKFFLGLYLGRDGTTSVYGAGAAFVVVLLYVYYSAVILFFGAEFTQVYAKTHGSIIKPSDHAEPITEEARAHQGIPRKTKNSPIAASRQHPGLAYAGPCVSIDPPSLSMKCKHATPPSHSGGSPLRHVAPLEVIRKQPMSFVLMAAGAGLAVAFLFKYKSARRFLALYTVAKRFI